MAFDNSFSGLNSKALATLMKDMDRDVATRFVASAFSLDKVTMKNALSLAYEEMAIRKKDQHKEKRSSLRGSGSDEKLKKSTKELVDSISALFKGQGMEDVEVHVVDSPDENGFEDILDVVENDDDADENEEK